MSWGTCFAGSNNTNFSYPALMSDGRISSWSQDAAINEQIKNNNGINSNFRYRQFLVNNTDSIISRNQVEACGQCCLCPSNYGLFDNPNSNKTPYLYNCPNNNGRPIGYKNSDLKNLYLSSAALNSRLYTPEVSLNQMGYIRSGLPNYN